MTPLTIILYALAISTSIFIIGIPIVAFYLAIKQNKKKG